MLTSHTQGLQRRPSLQQQTLPKPNFVQEDTSHHSTPQQASHRPDDDRRSIWEKSVSRELADVTGSVAETARSMAELRRELRSEGQLPAAPDAFAVAMAAPGIEAVKSYITAASDRLEIKIEGMNQHLTERLENITDHCIRLHEREQRLQEFLESHRSFNPSSSNSNSSALRQQSHVGGDPLTDMGNSRPMQHGTNTEAPEQSTNTIRALTTTGAEDPSFRAQQSKVWMVQTWLASKDGVLSDNHIERCWSYLYVASFWLIIANLAWIGISLIATVPSAKRGQQPPRWVFVGDVLFLVFFIIELLARLALEQRNFFLGPGKVWNAFDSVLTLCQILSLVDVISRVSWLRVVKSFRILRAARLLRTMKVLREARLIIQMEWKPFLWGFCMMFSISYLFAVLVAQSVSDWLLHNDGADDHMRKTVERYYGTFPSTLYIILLASAHGASWGDISEPLENVNWWLGPVFFAYIIVMNLNALHLITALYVDSVSHVSNFDRTLELSDTALQEGRLIEDRLKPLFEQADRNHDGRLSRDVMLSVFKKKDGAKALNDLKLDIASMKALFKLVDAEDRDSVSIDDFCAGIVHLKGNTSSVHMAMLLFQSRRLLVRLDKLGRTTESRLQTLKQMVALSNVNSSSELVSGRRGRSYA
mmetsp:Transcript_136988/g.273229  ORF Transcript_136988/g.273229 Transcript_136988/m.273229 type:complete len:647 (+) Transcript_136988:121-2061(+)